MTTLLRLLMPVFMLATTACVAGGGGSVHMPPNALNANECAIIEIELRVWGSGSSNIEKRYSDVKVVIDGNTIAMNLVNKDESRGIWRYTVPPGTFTPGDEVPYEIQFTFDGRSGSRSGALKYQKETAQPPNALTDAGDH